LSQVTQNVAIGLILAAGLVAVVATTIVLVLERRRQPREVETRTAAPPPSGHHVRLEINGTVFEVHSSDRLTRDEVTGLVQTALAAEDRRNQGPGAGSGA
jgi:hypothetical protein